MADPVFRSGARGCAAAAAGAPPPPPPAASAAPFPPEPGGSNHDEMEPSIFLGANRNGEQM
jgi:hypothetical protein